VLVDYFDCEDKSKVLFRPQADLLRVQIDPAECCYGCVDHLKAPSNVFSDARYEAIVDVREDVCEHLNGS
jgi:hypothetical protein